LKIIGVIQARMNSNRLPGKVMLSLLGKPIIHHIYDRLTTCKQLDAVVVSTGGYDNNKEICNYAKKHAFPLYIGNENDLIDRLYKTALKFEASAIVRITADCPIVDPMIVDKLVSEFLTHTKKHDIVTNCRISTFPHGLDVEVYSTKILKKLWSDIKELEFREWFPLYIKKNLKEFNILDIKNEIDLSHLRLTLDYEEDFKLIKLIYEEMQSNTFVLDDVLKLLEKKPELCDINKKYVGYHNIDAPT
jgi:spore coat polysaccharide biosynthesis protein SpsF